MSQRLRSFTVCVAVTLGILALHPATAHASDFGGIVTELLFLLAATASAALILSAATAGILARAFRRKALWFLIPIFAVGWFAAIRGVHELWMNLKYRDGQQHALQEPQIPLIPLPVPEGFTTQKGLPPVVENPAPE